MNRSTSSELELRLFEPDPNDEKRGLLFCMRRTPFVGRERAIEFLQAFCGRPEPFLICQMTGSDGIGKSRTAYEFCLSLPHEEWDRGFAFDRLERVPERPAFIVVDDFLSRVDEWPKFLTDLAENPPKEKVRVLLIGRREDLPGWKKALAGDAVQRSFAQDTLPLELGGLAQEAFADVLRACLPQALTESAGEIASWIDRSDAERSPLLAMLAADAFAANPNVISLDLAEVLVSDLFDRLERAGVDYEHGNLLMLAALNGPIRLDSTRYNELRREWNDWAPHLPWPFPSSFEDCRLSVLCPTASGAPIVTAPAPELVANPFVLSVLEGRWAARCGRSEGAARAIFEFAVHRDDSINEIDRTPLREFSESVASLRWSKIGLIEGLTQLGIDGPGPMDFTEITHWSSLRFLGLNEVRLLDLSFLSGLSSLKTLMIWDPPIADFSTLPKLSNLEELNIVGSSLQDLSPLAGLTSLRWLKLARSCKSIYAPGTRIADLSPLAGLTSLEELEVSHSEVSDLTPLSGLLALKDLDVRFANVSDLSPLARLSSLLGLTLLGNPVSDISPLAGLSLRYLDLGRTGVSDGTPLSKLTSLETLFLTRTQISDLTFLSGLTTLKCLTLTQTPVRNLRGLWDARALERLSLAKTKTTDLSGIEALSSLKALFVDETLVEDISPLSNLTSLEEIYLRDAPVSDLSPLVGLKNLHTLMIKGVAVSEAQLAELRRALPGCWIISDCESAETTAE